jgi:DNA-binding protein HU-beta
MTKSELARALAEELELPRKHVVEMMDAMLEKMMGVLKKGDKVQLTPFGQFKVRMRAARMGRNPMTGAAIKIPAKKVLKFIAGRPLKEAVGTAKRKVATHTKGRKVTRKPVARRVVAKPKRRARG